MKKRVTPFLVSSKFMFASSGVLFLRLSIFIVLCFFGLVGSAQLTFGDEQIITAQTDGKDVTTADLNNDGLPDLIGCNEFRNTIVWYENLGDGSFSNFQIITTNAERVWSVFAGDLDGDGDIDVLSAAISDNEIAWYENLGGGNFSSDSIISSTSGGAFSVYAEDLDEDGDLDVISTLTDDKLAWYENLGGGAFSAESIISNTTNGARSAFATDLDGDGDIDVISASQGINSVTWHENLGGGNFSSEIIISTNANGGPSSVYAEDLDGDGDMDVLSTSYIEDKIAWYENLGDGVFSSEIIISSNADGAWSVYAEDLDGDGDVDVLSASLEDNKIAWYENLGDGVFSSEIIISSNVNRPSSVCAADLNGDGGIDVFFASIYDGEIAWYENLGDGIFSAEIIISTNADGAQSVYTADLDGDGDIDVLSASQYDHKIAWYENVGDGAFSTEIIISASAEGAQSVYAIDLDTDGDIDVLSASQDDNKIAWYENLGNGVFSSEIIISATAEGALSVYAEDLDGDGDIDVLSASQGDYKIAWYENLGDGIFSAEIIISTTVNVVQAVYAEDLDGDGDMDVLVAGGTLADITWYKNQGDGAFSTVNIIPTSLYWLRSVYAEDLDGDGDIDVLSASQGDNKIAWYENQGEGAFSSEIIISLTATGAQSVYAKDLDGDGDIDVLSASNSFDDEIAWYENLGEGIFSSESIISTKADGPRSVFAEDIDGDGDMDVLSASQDDDKIAWYKNLLGGGCMDADACNFDVEATIENGSCCYDNCGCTNETATNYDPEATCENGSCIYFYSGFVYNDEDESGAFDNNDFALAFQEILIEPLGVTLITNDNGEFSFEYSNSQPLTFSAEFNPQFPFNTTLNPIILNPSFDSELTMEFGITEELVDFDIWLSVFPYGLGFLCNDWSRHNICYRNMGNVPIDGIVELEYDPLFQDHAEVTPIDSVSGNSVFMSFENLLPGQMFFYDVDLLTPTADHIGEIVTRYVRVTGFYEGEQVAYGEKTLTTVITCAYDPNDKQAFPLGYTDEHWLLQETEQEFLIRFQNTGNAPAQDVRIQDTLDVNFDLESFKLMANSHSVMTTIDPETRLIDFYFEDIQLPDSVNDEPNSHGLISYKITPLPNLPVGTILENTAYIYFDNNEPIITNTTWTTIHECGGEAAFTVDVLTACVAAEVQLASTYPHLTSLEWVIAEEMAGNGTVLSLDVLEPTDFDVMLLAENPLCSETASQTVQITDLGPPETCFADFNCDEERDVIDLLSLLSVFGEAGPYPEDLDANGLVNTLDIVAFLVLYNQGCEE